MFTVDTTRFYVISVLSNPVRYKKRFELYDEFEKHMKDLGATLITVEIAFGDRPFVMTQRDDKYDLQVRTDHELWLKENAINLAIAYLCQIDPDWKYVAWVDADIHFLNRNIVEETTHQLQHYDVVQMFSHVTDMGPNLEPLKTMQGFMYSYVKGGCVPPLGPGYSPYYGRYYGHKKGTFWHPGFAWAARRSALDRITLFDKAILGSADHHMAMGLIGCAERSLPKGLNQSYVDSVMNWQEIAEYRLRRNVGYVPGMITHFWHGSKMNRKYVERWRILIDNQYNPNTDISRDQQGLYRLNYHHGMRSITLRDQIRQYFRARHEDSIDVE